MHNLAIAHFDAGADDHAIAMLEECLKLLRRQSPVNPLDELTCMQSLAAMYIHVGKTNQTRTIIEQAYQGIRISKGASDPLTRSARNWVSISYQAIAARCVWLKQDQAYEEACRQAVAFVTDLVDAPAAERTAKIHCLKQLEDEAKLADALRYARLAVEIDDTKNPYFVMTLGMAEFRNGNYAKAAEVLKVPARDTSSHFTDSFPARYHINVTSMYYRAMSLFKLGRTDEAVRLATDAERRMKPVPANLYAPNSGRVHTDDVILWLAYREAKEMIKWSIAPAEQSSTDAASKSAQISK